MIETSDRQIHYLTAQWILPVSSAPIEWGFVAIQGERIQAVGHYNELPESWAVPPPQAGSLITPGLINTHVHLEQSFPKPIPKAETEPFVDWLLNVIQTTRPQNEPEAKFNRCLQGAEEALKTGTTFLNDIASGAESLTALQKTGLKGFVSLEVFHPGFEPIQIEHWLKQYQALQDSAQGHPRVQVGLSPHSLYNVSPQAWQALQAALHPPLIHTHMAEFEAETHYLAGNPSDIDKLHQQVLNKTFKPKQPTSSPIQTLLNHHLLETPTVLAHAIHTTAHDRALMASFPVGIAHCPRSNLALHNQTLHWPHWQDSPIPMGLGTDGRLSTPNLDLRDEARCAIGQHHWTPEQALYSLTMGGAKVLQMAQALGSLEAGKQADLVVWQATASAQGSLPAAMIFDADTRVIHVMVDGESLLTGEEP